MRSGQCPRCGGEDVYVHSNVTGYHAIPVTTWTSAAVDHYVCVSCGYVETYVADAAKLRDITEANAWARLQPPPLPARRTDPDDTRRLD